MDEAVYHQARLAADAVQSGCTASVRSFFTGALKVFGDGVEEIFADVFSVRCAEQVATGQLDVAKRFWSESLQFGACVTSRIHLQALAELYRQKTKMMHHLEAERLREFAQQTIPPHISRHVVARVLDGHMDLSRVETRQVIVRH